MSTRTERLSDWVTRYIHEPTLEKGWAFAAMGDAHRAEILREIRMRHASPFPDDAARQKIGDARAALLRIQHGLEQERANEEHDAAHGYPSSGEER